MRRLVIRIAAFGAVAAAWLALQPSSLSAQRGAERGQTIVIRAQVPTPQVITVRPRTVPEYSREVLGSEQRQRSFWGSLLPAYQLVTQRQIDGRDPLDSAVAALVAGAPPGAAGAAGAAARGGTDSSARAVEIEAVRQEIAERRARLDSLERAIRGEQGRENVARSSELPELPKLSPADSAARAREIETLYQLLDIHRARLDSLEAVVRSLGRTRAQPDSVGMPRDSTRSPR
jgi:hypothetical protein